jgi:hypothetical protein
MDRDSAETESLLRLGYSKTDPFIADPTIRR